MVRSRTGTLKMKLGGFQRNHTAWNKGQTFSSSLSSTQTDKKPTQTLKRLTHQEFDRTFKLSDDQDEFLPVAEQWLGVPAARSPRLLRPKTIEKSEVEKKLEKGEKNKHVSGYTEVHLPTAVDAVQDCIIEHKKSSPLCQARLSTDADLTTKWGITAEIKLKCNTCNFISARHKLYREVPSLRPGRNSAEPNWALAVGMVSGNVGIPCSQRLFSTIGNTVPSTSSMQRQLNHAGDKIRDLNEKDMAKQITVLKNTLEYAGYPRDTPIPAECDRQYNNSLRGGRRHTPQAPATQSRDIIAENLTTEKKIIGYHQENKLCKKGEIARKKGNDVQCPGHTSCTATIPASANIGDEKSGGRKLAQALRDGIEPIKVGMLATDADGRMAEGFSTVMKESGVTTEHFLDTVHLNRAITRAISNSKIKINLETKTKTTYLQRNQAKNRLGDSMATRAEQEVRKANLKHKNDINSVTKAMAKVMPAMIACYQGDHSLCAIDSFVCNGKRIVYQYLPKYTHGAFRFSQDDIKQLTTILSKRLGKEALQLTRFGMTTQKVESMNHAFSTTYPKHSMTCYRNGANRDHSAIHMVNNLVGDSLLLKNESCGLHVSSNSQILPALHQMNKRQQYHTRRSKSKAYKCRSANLRMKRYNLYDMTHNESFYKRDQLLPK